MLILKKQQRFKSERYFKINLSSNDNKKNAIINSAETYPYGMSKDIIWKKEKIRRIVIYKSA